MKVALITGGSSGIGAATAKDLARRGWKVVINFSKDKSKADEVARACKGIAIQADVAKDAECRRLAAEVVKQCGGIDALVNNAGTTKVVAHNDLEGLSAEDFQRVYELNVVAPFQVTRACAAALKERRGAIVNVSSVAAELGTGSSVAYAASKAALNAMSFSLARSLAPEVRVNVVSPGHTRTPWHIAARGAERAAEVEKRYASVAPLRDASDAEDVADAIVWLIEGARRTTGEVIFVDGGIHIAAPR